jgi:hypothetical protein
MLADHLAVGTELLPVGTAVVALAAGQKVVDAHPVTSLYCRVMGTDHGAYLDDHAGNFVAQRLGKGPHRRSTLSIVYIGMTDAGGLDLHEDLARANSR